MKLVQGPEFENQCSTEGELIYCYLHSWISVFLPYKIVGRSHGSAVKMPGFESQLCHCVVTLEKAFKMAPIQGKCSIKASYYYMAFKYTVV